MNSFAKEYLLKLLRFDAESPLIFTGLYFWVFFTLVFTVFAALQNRITWRNFFLFLTSIFFYYKTSNLYFVLLLFTVCSDFVIGHRLYKSHKPIVRSLLLALSVTLNLFILFYFKYAYFFTESYNALFGSEYRVLNYFAVFEHSITGKGSIADRIILPVGISFYTFQAISYTTDIYKKRLKPLNNLFDFGFYVSFFPQLVAGPIVRASEFIPQMHRKYRLSGYQFGLALFMILTGLLKKMVFGDYMAVQFIDKVFADPISYPGFANLMAVFAYSLQVYLDFSGYTDIAIGVALLMGFRFNTNFNSPYKALNVGEFWKRWHISLSTWLRDYLYIPLGGNRKGSWASYILILFMLAVFILLLDHTEWFVYAGIGVAVIAMLAWFFPGFKRHIDTNINLMITMLLGGFWHGSTWNFVVWGGLNGVGLVAYKYMHRLGKALRGSIPGKQCNALFVRVFKASSILHRVYQYGWRALQILLTFGFITFTRIWFRAPDKETADLVLDKIGFDMDWSLAFQILEGYDKVFILFTLGMIVHWLPHNWKRRYRLWFIKSPVWVKLIVVLLCIFAIWQTLSAEFVPFIYFQF